MFLNIDAKYIEVGKVKEDERDCIRRLLSNWQTFFNFFVMYFFLSFQSALSLVRIRQYIFLRAVNFDNL